MDSAATVRSATSAGFPLDGADQGSWASSFVEILEKFELFEGILEEFMRKNIISNKKNRSNRV